jgi:hypothetical protein
MASKANGNVKWCKDATSTVGRRVHFSSRSTSFSALRCWASTIEARPKFKFGTARPICSIGVDTRLEGPAGNYLFCSLWSPYQKCYVREECWRLSRSWTAGSLPLHCSVIIIDSLDRILLTNESMNENRIGRLLSNLKLCLMSPREFLLLVVILARPYSRS